MYRLQPCFSTGVHRLLSKDPEEVRRVGALVVELCVCVPVPSADIARRRIGNVSLDQASWPSRIFSALQKSVYEKPAATIERVLYLWLSFSLVSLAVCRENGRCGGPGHLLCLFRFATINRVRATASGTPPSYRSLLHAIFQQPRMMFGVPNFPHTPIFAQCLVKNINSNSLLCCR